MKVYKTISILISVVISCNFCYKIDNRIQTIKITQNEGVGPNSFLFILKISSNELLRTLKKRGVKIEFSTPLKELSASSIRCFQVSKQELHVRVVSTHWADLNQEEINVKEQKINKEQIYMKITNTQNKSWFLYN